MAETCVVLCLLESGKEEVREDSPSDRLSFYRFDISRLLRHGASLLGSAGAEFDVQEDESGKASTCPTSFLSQRSFVEVGFPFESCCSAARYKQCIPGNWLQSACVKYGSMMNLS